MQLPPGSQAFGVLSIGELRQMQGAPDGHFESVKHSSYVHCCPACPKLRHRPLVPASQSESEEQQTVVGGGGVGHAGRGVPFVETGMLGFPGPRCAGQVACMARW